MTSVSLDRPIKQSVVAATVPSLQMTVAKGKKCGQVHKLRGTNKPGFWVEKKLKANLFHATLVTILRSSLLRK
jgi:hypothetical protein